MADDEVKTDSAEVETPVNHVNSMVDSLVSGDNVAAQDAFKSAFLSSSVLRSAWLGKPLLSKATPQHIPSTPSGTYFVTSLNFF